MYNSRCNLNPTCTILSGCVCANDKTIEEPGSKDKLPDGLTDGNGRFDRHRTGRSGLRRTHNERHRATFCNCVAFPNMNVDPPLRETDVPANSSKDPSFIFIITEKCNLTTIIIPRRCIRTTTCYYYTSFYHSSFTALLKDVFGRLAKIQTRGSPEQC